MHVAKPLSDLVAALGRLPGIGPKSAQRLAFHILRLPDDEVDALSETIREAKRALRFCSICQNFTVSDPCEICSDPRRDRGLICVVGEPRDVIALERLNEYRGVYHVLHGLLDPIAGVGPEHIRVRELLHRLQTPVTELILATNPTIEGDATALYLANLIKPIGVKVSRLAHGMPIGGELDYADSATLLSALEYRREM